MSQTQNPDCHHPSNSTLRQSLAERRMQILDEMRQIGLAPVDNMLSCLEQAASQTVKAVVEAAPMTGLPAGLAGKAAKPGQHALCGQAVGVILVAGGQGTRLGFDGPKGCYAIGPISGASLFEIHAGKIFALQRRYQTVIPLYIMTSQSNDADTREFFAENEFFGLNPDDVTFFRQGMLPALTPDGKLIFDRPAHVFTAPDGHGGTLAALQRNGCLDDMEQRGLATLFYFQVDNPLVEVADPAFIGLHVAENADMSVKVCTKRDPDEGLGVVVKRPDGRLAVVEYTELSPEQKHARDANGELKFKYGSVAIHAFSLEFLKKQAAADLPLHPAFKKVPYCDENGNTVCPEKPNAYKFEKFIFDALPNAERPLIVRFERGNEFSPVKNAKGDDSPETARRDMMRKAARWLKAAGVEVPCQKDGTPVHRVEIQPGFAADPEELKERLPPDIDLDRDVLVSGSALKNQK